jgi:tryptophan synthase alpha chain
VTRSLEAALRAKRADGKKLLIPYITGGLDGWTDCVRAAVANGADAIEIGVPFSDPVMDGPVIQEASWKALEAGATPQSILDEARELDVDVPLAVMTYYNLAYRAGHQRFAANLIAAGISGLHPARLALHRVWAVANGSNRRGCRTGPAGCPHDP